MRFIAVDRYISMTTSMRITVNLGSFPAARAWQYERQGQCHRASTRLLWRFEPV